MADTDPTTNDLGGDAAQSQPDAYFGTTEVDDRSPYQDVMRYPIYYDNAVDNDDTNGRVVLSDCKTCVVTMNRNQIPICQITYPRDGIASKIMKPEGVVMTDCNTYLTHQKFRVKEMLKDGDQFTMNLTHIIGDLAGITLGQDVQVPDCNPSQFCDAILSAATDDLPDIRVDSDISDVRNVDINFKDAGNLSNFIFDADQEGDKPTNSLVALYNGEIVADNYHIIFNKKLGCDTGIVVKYGDRIQTIQQDNNIEQTYTAIYPYATYTPGQAKATTDNTDWANWSTDYSNIGSVTYCAGGTVEIYDSPVTGHSVIGTVSVGDHLTLGTPIHDGDFTPDGKLEIDTVNGDDWYPIEGGGWIDGNWVNFDKSGDYLVNDATGHVHTAISDDDNLNTHYPISGTGTVSNNGIRVFYSPDPGKGHRTTGKHMKLGARIHYDQVATDENGVKWYRIGPHQWLYGPHVKVNSEQDMTRYPSQGYGYVKKNAQSYYINKNHMMVPKTHKGKLVSTRKKKTPKYKYVWRGKGKKRHRVKEKTYYYGKTTKYHKQVKSHAKKGYAHLNYGQVVIGGVTYYKLSNGTYVKSSSIDWKASRSHQPTLPKDLIKQAAQKKGWIEMYSSPSKGHSMNITVPVGQGFAISHTAEGADGNTWYEITYKGHTGWILGSETSSTADEDLEPTSSDKDETDQGGSSGMSLQSEVLVTLGSGSDGLVFPENPGQHEVQRVENVDLSNYIKHDDQDLSGQQPDGSFVATDDDKAQLLAAAKDYVIEHRIGQPNISLTVQYAQSSDVEGDLTALNLYDTVTVYFEKLGISEKAEVSSTVYDALAHHYTQVTIGDIPKTWQHLLVDAANKETGELSRRVATSQSHNHHLFADIHAALQKEGSDRIAAEKDIAKRVGLVDEKTGKLDISFKQLDSQMQSIDSDVTDISNEILSGGTQELRFYPNVLHPTEIEAHNDDGSYLVLNSNGLGFFDSAKGVVRSAITSEGQIAAELLDAGEIKALNVSSGEFHGALNVGEGTGINIHIGTNQPANSGLSPTYGGRAIWLDTPGSGSYHAMLSTGMLQVRDGNDLWEYGTNGVRHNGESLYDIVKRWVSGWIYHTCTITHIGAVKPIWKG